MYSRPSIDSSTPLSRSLSIPLLFVNRSILFFTLLEKALAYHNTMSTSSHHPSAFDVLMSNAYAKKKKPQISTRSPSPKKRKVETLVLVSDSLKTRSDTPSRVLYEF
ncbi:unnamed protein product [Microthlaspi erraticum]|uniref:Uncharacterized protein n=1 Tax=Microthlaspi erraticum TaxID=1685480 RepID=A0A6D2LCQ0_9BRAS|nr:unnamed protein product [Microthlaspi erraticum]